jgi:hypothetical protein
MSSHKWKKVDSQMGPVRMNTWICKTCMAKVFAMWKPNRRFLKNRDDVGRNCEEEIARRVMDS